jgi:hypothetical protein
LVRYQSGECISCGHNHSATTVTSTTTTTTTTSTTTTDTTTILPTNNDDVDFIFEPNNFNDPVTDLEFNAIFHMGSDDSHNTTDNEY